MQLKNLILFLLLLVSSECVVAQEAKQTEEQPPKLKSLFADDFQKDTRADYEVEGDVSWKKGRLRLAPDSSLTRKLKGGSWVEVKLDLKFSKLEQNGDQPIFLLELQFEGATSCLVAWIRTRKADTTTANVRIFDTDQKDGKTQFLLVRQREVAADLPSGVWTVSYCNGLLRVHSPQRALLDGFIENGSATVRSFRLRALGKTSQTGKIELASADPARALSEEDSKELATALQLSQTVVQLWQQGKSVEAIEPAQQALRIRSRILGKYHSDHALSVFNLAAQYEALGNYAKAEPLYLQAREIYKRVLGEGHPGYAMSLNNLAFLYKSMGDYAKAEPLYLQSRDIRKRVLGETHLDYAASLNNLGELYYLTREYAKAEAPWVKALEIRKQALGEEHLSYGASLHNLAELYRVMGEHTKAEPLFVQSLDLLKKAQGEENPNYATTVTNLGLLYYATGDYAKAEPLYRQARDIRGRVLGESHPLYAASLNNLGLLSYAMGDYVQAETFHKQARDIRRRVLGEEHSEYAQSLNNLGLLYSATGDYAEAERLHRRARDIRGRVLGKAHPDYAQSLNNLGGVYYVTGEYAKAEPLHRQSRDIRKRVLGEEHPDYAGSLNNLAALYQSVGDYAKAEAMYTRTRDIHKEAQGEEHPDYATGLDNLGLLYYLMGDYGKAKPLFVQALDIRKRALGEEHPDYADSLNALALLYYSIGDVAKAEPLFEQARDIRKRVLGDEHPHYASSLNNLAYLYQSMGDYAMAERLYMQARDIYKKALGEEHPQFAIGLNNLALLHWSRGDYAEAEPLHRQARDIRKRVLGKAHPEYAQSLYNLALLYGAMGNYAKAESLCTDGLRLQNNTASALLAGASEAQGLNHLATRPMIKDVLMSVYLKLDKPDADLYASIWQGRRLLQRVTSQRKLQLYLTQREASPQAREDFERYSLTRRRIARLILTSAETDSKKTTQREEEIVRLDSEKERLEKSLARTLPGFADQLENQRGQPRELWKQLPANAVFIDLVRYALAEQNPSVPGNKGQNKTSSYAAFVLHADQPIVRVELGPARPIDDAARAWRASVAERRSDREAAGTLSRLVWQPVAKAIPKNVKTLSLCPDSSLAVIPWAALPTGNGDQVLLEDYSVALVPHGHYLLRQLNSKTEESVAKKLLLVGDVSYGSRPAGSSLETTQLAAAARHRDAALGDQRIEWPALPGGSREVADIERLAGNRTIQSLTADQATTNVVLEELPAARYAHFATHGFFADKKFRSYLQLSEENFEQDRSLGQIGNRSTFAGRNPLVLSGLVFAGANLPREKDEYGIPIDDGGLLTAEAIADLPLYDLKLAVLSACETGLGDVAGGEGVYGLQRAFHTAGAHNVIASLWKVNDDATAALMRLFYYKLWKENKPPLEALREAQLYIYRNPTKIKDLARAPNFAKTETLVQSATSVDPKRSATKDWAAFVLSGLGR